MKEVIKTLANPRGYTVEEDRNGNILIYDNKPFYVIPFKDRAELYEFLNQLREILPPQDTDLRDKYLGEKWKYDG